MDRGKPGDQEKDLETIMEMEDRTGTGITPKRRVAMVRATGSVLWDTTGKQYLDLGANYGVCNVGHGHPEVLAAVRKQMERLLYITPTFYNDARAGLQERLASITPEGVDRVFLCNSGTEAVEAAIKFARGHTGRSRMVAAKRGFHGRSLGALSATWNKRYRKSFEPLVPDFDFVGYGDLEALKEVVDGSTAAVLLEPVQGEGGVHPAPEGYLEGAREICDDTGAMLVADEIQTGLGRTGRMFAMEHWDVVPDIMTVAKSLGGGLPIGAMVAREEICDLPTATHGSTFSGSPVACAAGMATIDVLENENLVERARALGEYTIERLRAFSEDVKAIREVRGLGLMIGMELKRRNGPYLRGMLEGGVVALPAGRTVIRLLPPLTISRQELDCGLMILEEVLSDG